MSVDITRLQTQLTQTKLQKDNNPLFQIMKDLLTATLDLQNSSFTQTSEFNLIQPDTTSSPQSVKIPKSGKTIVKDVKGNAGVNNITITETVDGVVNPVINTNYGIFRVLWNGQAFHQW